MGSLNVFGKAGMSPFSRRSNAGLAHSVAKASNSTQGVGAFFFSSSRIWLVFIDLLTMNITKTENSQQTLELRGLFLVGGTLLRVDFFYRLRKPAAHFRGVFCRNSELLDEPGRHRTANFYFRVLVRGVGSCGELRVLGRTKNSA